jgi:CRISPR-associated protein Cas1
MGPDFRRDQGGEGANALLNYGYTVLRATVSRAICAAGLHPSIGLHHSNRANAFALADDLMEPYRPIIDRGVYNLVQDGVVEVSPAAKTALVALTTLDLPALLISAKN